MNSAKNPPIWCESASRSEAAQANESAAASTVVATSDVESYKFCDSECEEGEHNACAPCSREHRWRAKQLVWHFREKKLLDIIERKKMHIVHLERAHSEAARGLRTAEAQRCRRDVACVGCWVCKPMRDQQAERAGSFAHGYTCVTCRRDLSVCLEAAECSMASAVEQRRESAQPEPVGRRQDGSAIFPLPATHPIFTGQPATPEAEAIAAAHPMRTGRHHLYGEAMRLVGERHDKGDLVDLVTWLLHRIENHEARPEAEPPTATPNASAATESPDLSIGDAVVHDLAAEHGVRGFGEIVNVMNSAWVRVRWSKNGSEGWEPSRILWPLTAKYRDLKPENVAPAAADRPSEAVVWADDATPFDGPQVKDLLVENERLRIALAATAKHLGIGFEPATDNTDALYMVPEQTDNVLQVLRNAASGPSSGLDIDTWISRFVRPHLERRCDGITVQDCVDTIREDMLRTFPTSQCMSKTEESKR